MSDWAEQALPKDHPMRHKKPMSAEPTLPVSQPEEDTRKCQDCGRDNPVWFADNEVWNAVFPERVGFVCPNCFIKRADPVVQNAGWKLIPDTAERDRELQQAQYLLNVSCEALKAALADKALQASLAWEAREELARLKEALTTVLHTARQLIQYSTSSSSHALEEFNKAEIVLHAVPENPKEAR